MTSAELLRSTHPFDTLPAALFALAAAAAVEARFPAGTWLVRAGGEPLRHLHLIQHGSVRLERDGQTLQVLEEGETFGYTSLILGKATLDVVVEEDLVAYLLPAATFARLTEEPRFAGHFAAGLGERLRSSLERPGADAFQADLSGEVARLVRGPPLWAGPDTTVAEAARAMRGARSSAILVRGEPPGILTDRDLRDRVVAEGLPGDTPVGRVATFPLVTAPAGAPVYEAWLSMLDADVHHLPLVRGTEVVGMVDGADVMRSWARGPVAVVQAVERLASREELDGYAARVSEMVAALVAARVDAVAVARLVARANDTLLRPILRWAEADLGPAPVPFAWMAMGSEGRMEQTLLTDQDNALVHAEADAAARGWFQAFAERVNDDLEAAGFPRCPGGYMARAWNGTLAEWSVRLRGWMHERSPQALLDLAIFLDARRVAGRLDADSLQELTAAAAEEPVFLRAMVEGALRFRPPPMLRLRLRGTSSVVDLKKHGLSPIVFLARCYALEVGSRARGTLDRLEAAERAGLLAPNMCGNLSEAFRFLLALRLRIQLRTLAQARPVSNEVALSELTPLERTRLKDAFRAVSGWQDLAANRHQL